MTTKSLKTKKLEDEELDEEPEEDSAEHPVVEDESDWDDDDEEFDDAEEMSLEALGHAYAAALGTTPALPSTPEEPETSDADSVPRQETAKKEKSWDDVLAEELQHCPISPESIVEAILFVGSPKGTKLTSRNIAAVLRDVSPKEITQVAKSLRKLYDDEGYAFGVHSEKGVHRLELQKRMAYVQRHFLGRDKPVKLNQAVIDVLAVVAYNQPITKERVEKLRARSSGSILNQLVRRNLIALRVTDEKPKRKLYETTDRFLDLFALESLDDLPEIELFE